MGSILLFLLLVLAVIFFLGVGFIMRIVNFFTRGTSTGNKRNPGSSNRNGSNRNEHQQTSNSTENHKVFRKDEGEYVDFEEIK